MPERLKECQEKPNTTSGQEGGVPGMLGWGEAAQPPALRSTTLGAHRPKRLTKSPTEKDPIMPPTEKMATERDQSVVRVAGLMGSSYRYSQVRL